MVQEKQALRFPPLQGQPCDMLASTSQFINSDMSSAFAVTGEELKLTGVNYEPVRRLRATL